MSHKEKYGQETKIVVSGGILATFLGPVFEFFFSSTQSYILRATQLLGEKLRYGVQICPLPFEKKISFIKASFDDISLCGCIVNGFFGETMI